MMLADPDVQQFLLWAMGTTGAALLGVLVWLALGVIANQKASDKKSEEQFKSFGQQLSSVKDLLNEDLHRHDVRITRLEEWRKAKENLRGGED